MELHLIKLDTNFDLLKTYPILESYLTDEEVKSLSLYRFKKDRNVAVISRIGLKYFLAMVLSIPIKDINIKYNKYGKPYINNHLIEFNLSHSENTILYGFGQYTLGVDIEIINPILPETVQFFMSNEELNHFFSLTDKQAQKEFYYEIWTTKESLFKAIGTGITYNITQITAPFDQNEDSLKFNGICYFFHKGKFGHNFYYTVCSSQKEDVKKKTKVWNWKELIYKLK